MEAVKEGRKGDKRLGAGKEGKFLGRENEGKKRPE